MIPKMKFGSVKIDDKEYFEPVPTMADFYGAVRENADVIVMSNGVKCTINPNIGGSWPYSCSYELNKPYPGGMMGGSGNSCTGDLKGSPDVKSCTCTKKTSAQKTGATGASVAGGLMGLAYSNPQLFVVGFIGTGVAIAGIVGYVLYKKLRRSK